MEVRRVPTGRTTGGGGNGHGHGQLGARATHGSRTGRVFGCGHEGADVKCVHGREGTNSGHGLLGARSKHGIGRTTSTLCDHL
jgi:hypothetical protein